MTKYVFPFNDYSNILRLLTIHGQYTPRRNLELNRMMVCFLCACLISSIVKIIGMV